jgi:hypothetical protein
LYVGEKGTYLDVVLIETPDNKFGNDFIAKQDCGKENRDIAPILGNAKTLRRPDAIDAPPAALDEQTDDLPF